jgi:molybdenum cofactor cytidylyltransferase
LTGATTEIEGILLAAGESRRMGSPKPLLEINGETYLAHLATGMLTAVTRLVIVVGAQAERIKSAVPIDRRIAIVENRNFQRGQLSSLKIALTAVAPSAPAIMVHLVDHPRVRADTFEKIAEFYQITRKPIIIARANGRRGHPILFDRSLFDELHAASNELGARVVVNADPSRVAYLDLADDGILLDLDTPQDVAAAGLQSPLAE